MIRLHSLLLAPALVALALVAPACAGDDSGGTHDTHGTDTGTDTGGAEVDTYSDGMMKTSANGHFMIALTSDPGPPVKGDNTWTLVITDHEGADLEGGTVVVTPWMPAHGHGSTNTAVVSDMGGGAYEATPVTLQMAGTWDTTIEISGNGMTDEVHFVFEIPEA